MNNTPYNSPRKPSNTTKIIQLIKLKYFQQKSFINIKYNLHDSSLQSISWFLLTKKKLIGNHLSNIISIKIIFFIRSSRIKPNNTIFHNFRMKR